LDGTLLDSRQDLTEAVQYALRSLNSREPPTGDEIIAQVGKTLSTITQNLGYAFSKGQITLFENTYRSYYEKHFQDHTKIFPGVIDTLRKLQTQEIRMAVITTKHQFQADMVVKAFGLNKYFYYIRGWLEGRQHKPEPGPVLDTLRALDRQPNQVLYVGDSEQDVLCGQAAKVDTCAVTYGFRSAEYLRSLNPTYIIDHFSDILSIITK
jgi:HAD superfamily hydrolase (TIGR01549 family)